MMHKSKKDRLLLRIMSPQFSLVNNCVQGFFFGCELVQVLKTADGRAMPGVHTGAAAHHSGFGSNRNCQCVRSGVWALIP